MKLYGTREAIETTAQLGFYLQTHGFRPANKQSAQRRHRGVVGHREGLEFQDPRSHEALEAQDRQSVATTGGANGSSY